MRLCDTSGQRDLHLHPCGGRRVGGDAGHGFEVEAEGADEVALLGGGAVDGGVAGVDAGHEEALVAGAAVDRLDVLQRRRGGVDELGPRLGARDNPRVDQARGPDDDPG